MPKRPDREQLRQVERKVERAKNELLSLHYDLLHRDGPAVEAAKLAHTKARNSLKRKLRRQETLTTRLEQYEAKLESLKEILGIDD